MVDTNERSRAQLAERPAEGFDGLLGDVANGSRAAFESLYDATSDKLFGICLLVLADRAAAEDVLQGVYISVWHKAAQFDAKRASPMTWLAMLSRSRAIYR